MCNHFPSEKLAQLVSVGSFCSLILIHKLTVCDRLVFPSKMILESANLFLQERVMYLQKWYIEILDRLSKALLHRARLKSSRSTLRVQNSLRYGYFYWFG